MLRDLLGRSSKNSTISETILKNMRWFLYDGLFAASSLAIINTFYTLYLEALGATSAQIGLLSSLTNTIMLLVMLPGAWVSERIGSRKNAVLFTMSGLSRFFILVSAFVPFWFTGQAAVMPVIAVKLLIDNTNIIGTPAWTSLSADIVPIHYRGRYFAVRGLVMNISTMVTTLAIGRLITGIGKPEGFQVAMGIAFVIGMISTVLFAQIKEPPKRTAARPSYSPRSLIATLRDDCNLRNFSIYVFMWNASIALAGPFFSIYIVRELHASTATVGTLSVLATLSGLPSTYFFGKLVDKHGGHRILTITGFLVPFLPWLWMLARAPWGALPAYLYDGFVWAGYSLASFSFILSLTKPSRLALYNSIIQVVVSLGAIVGASLGGVLIGELGFRTVFFLSGAGRMLSMFFFWRMVKKADESACVEDEPEVEPQPAS